MRIICPNCNAQYEIADDLVPAEGREVQCSNCGSTWFQEGRARAAAAAAPSPSAPVGPDPDGTGPAIPADASVAAESERGEAGPAAAPRRRRPADAAALDILRQEREREERLRAAEGLGSSPDGAESDEDGQAFDPVPEAPATTSPATDRGAQERARLAAAASVARTRNAAGEPAVAEDVTRSAEPARALDPAGLSDAVPAERVDGAALAADPEVPDAMAEATQDAGTEAAAGDDSIRPDPAAAPIEEEDPRAARRALLPDIEEINSSLRPDDRAAEAEAEAEAVRADGTPAAASGGFRIGFLMVCAVVALLVGAYVFAAPLSEAVPSFAPALDDWVGWVTEMRIRLEAGIESLLVRIAPQG